MTKGKNLALSEWFKKSILWLMGLSSAALLGLSLWFLSRQRTPEVSPSVNQNQNIQALAKILISEASIGNEAERQAVGLTVINRMKVKNTNKVEDVLITEGFYHYASNQDPKAYPEYVNLAKSLLEGKVKDFTNNSTHFFSPYSMPKAGEKQANFDCGGGLVRYLNPVTTKTEMVCTPSWSKSLKYISLKNKGIRPYYFEFYTQ